MKLNSLKTSRGAKKKPKRRVGRGPGSGSGKTASKGHKGQKARSGGVKGPGFEGGQMPLSRRLPKRGFVNIFKKKFQIINLEQLNGFQKNTVVNIGLLKEKGLVSKARSPIKILSEGELKVPLTIQANAFSEKAKEKIISVGGKAEVI
ncbi:MAG TPA: 50S ribosomal protein L15 [Nitrospiria bacterium]|jgi:large subunit ribosomal protein L15